LLLHGSRVRTWIPVARTWDPNRILSLVHGIRTGSYPSYMGSVPDPIPRTWDPYRDPYMDPGCLHMDPGCSYARVWRAARPCAAPGSDKSSGCFPFWVLISSLGLVALRFWSWSSRGGAGCGVTHVSTPKRYGSRSQGAVSVAVTCPGILMIFQGRGPRHAKPGLTQKQGDRGEPWLTRASLRLHYNRIRSLHSSSRESIRVSPGFAWLLSELWPCSAARRTIPSCILATPGNFVES
jgi:hypothetical protein